MVKGRAGTMTHDYKRNGTTTLFAALNVLTGVVLGPVACPRHRNGEFLTFLKAIDRQTPKGSGYPPDPGQLRHPTNTPTSRPGLGQAPPLPPALHPRRPAPGSTSSNAGSANLTDKALRRGVFPLSPRPDHPRSRPTCKPANDEPKPLHLDHQAPTQSWRRSARGRSHPQTETTGLILRHCTSGHPGRTRTARPATTGR